MSNSNKTNRANKPESQSYKINKNESYNENISWTNQHIPNQVTGLLPLLRSPKYFYYKALPQKNLATVAGLEVSSTETQNKTSINNLLNNQEEQEYVKKAHKNKPYIINALDVALYFLYRVDREAGDTISPLKLQKLVYYAQAWNLALKDTPLFSDPIQAWVHGPVVYKVWEVYKCYTYSAIPLPSTPLPEFTGDQIEVLDEVWNVYGELSAKRLEQLTHSETPWLKARKGLNASERSQNIISLDDMKSYYLSLMTEDGEEKQNP